MRNRARSTEHSRNNPTPVRRYKRKSSSKKSNGGIFLPGLDARILLLTLCAALVCLLISSRRHGISRLQAVDGDTVGENEIAAMEAAIHLPGVDEATRFKKDPGVQGRLRPGHHEVLRGLPEADASRFEASTSEAVIPNLRAHRSEADIMPDALKPALAEKTKAGEKKHKWNKMNGGISVAKVCDLDGLSIGSWQNTINTWKPSSCNIDQSLVTAMKSCLSHKRIGLYGDSALRSIALAMLKEGGKPKIAISETGKKPTLGFSHKLHINGGEVNMHWSPSVFRNKPSKINIGALAKDDITIIGIGQLDMVNHRHRVTDWFSSMIDLLTDAASVRNGKGLFVMQIHQLNPVKCEPPTNKKEGSPEWLAHLENCRRCSSNDALQAYREALASAVSCVRSKGLANIHLIDTLGITNNTYASMHAEGVSQYDHVIASVEMIMVLGAACMGMRHMSDASGMEEDTCPDYKDGSVSKHVC
mmetsp:Transcript_3627/g.8481  ORF Transcript_3627/g.8481 Transcript_3627/m.8481 type:complete len:474 (+) Transcript_3627:225-1646(+)